MGEQLYYLTQHPYSGRHHWVKGRFIVKNPRFLHEENHTSEDFPEESIRLLALVRYWNAIEYYFPYRYLIKEPWDDVLLKAIPTFIQAQNKADYRLALRALTRWYIKAPNASPPILAFFRKFLLGCNASFRPWE